MYAKLIGSGMGSSGYIEPEGNCWGFGIVPTGHCIFGIVPKK